MRRSFTFHTFSIVLILNLLLGAAGSPQPVLAAGTVSLISGTTYTENFDTLANTGTSNLLPNGWYFSEAGGDSTYAAGTGSDNTGNTYSFGSAGSTERAFGEVTSNTVVSIIGASFSNNTGDSILSLTINYTGEQWRRGNTGADRIDFQYSTDATSLTTGTWTDVNSLDFTSPVTSGVNDPLDGNASPNRSAVGYTITGLDIINGSSFWVRWSAFNAVGRDDGLAVDDFSLKPILNNHAPTDIALSNGSVGENEPVNAAVGTLSTTDADAGNTFTYSLVSGTGDADNASFNILGDSLRTSTVFDHETQSNYSVRIRTTDQGGLWFEKVFTVTVTDVDDAFVDTADYHFNSGVLGDCVVDAGVGNGALKLALPQTSCQFVSRVFDAGDLVDWIGLDWTGTTSTEATITMAVRTGNADGTWTNWQADRDPLNNFGGQYIQYQATLTTTDSGQTPVLEEVTLNYVNKAYAVLQAPVGTLTDWDHVFRWTGRASATNYLLEVYKPDNTFALWKWYTAAQAGCAGGTECSITPAETLNLANGEYKWRVADYDTTDGYGIITNLSNFTLSGACYTLTKDVNPSGSGAVTASAVNCAGGYTAGTVVQVSVVPSVGYVFTGWSGGGTSGTSLTTTVTMDGDKSVRANLRGNTLISPVGTLTTWNNVFSWTGHAEATHYLLEVYKADNTFALWKWYTAEQAGCAGGSACSLSPVQLAGLANGDYIWVIRDYGAYGYGAYTPAKPFSLNAACYTLTTSASPSVGGNVTTSAVNCEGGYTAGTVVQVSVVPSVGYVFTGWSGGGTSGTSLTTSVTMDGDKSVTANLRGNTLISPVGTLTTWNNVFSWTGHAEATHYLLEVYKADNTFALWKWYTAEQAGCAGGSACSLSPVQLAGLANGDYKWRILDYGAYGYGRYSPLLDFSLSQ